MSAGSGPTSRPFRAGCSAGSVDEPRFWSSSSLAEKKQTPTLEGFAEEFLAYQATINKPGVVDSKRSDLQLHLLPAFGKRRLDQIDERAIDAYTVEKLEHITPRGTRIQPATVNKHLELLGRMLRVARKWKLVGDVPEINLLEERKPDFDFFDFEEADAFLSGAVEHQPQWHPYMVVAIRTGLRVGEMVALRWRDVDLDRGRLEVQRLFTLPLVGCFAAELARCARSAGSVHMLDGSHGPQRGSGVVAEALFARAADRPL